MSVNHSRSNVSTDNQCQALAQWALNSSWRKAGSAERDRIKLHLLDAIGCALGALGCAAMEAIRREQSAHAPGWGVCSTIGGSATTPERAAFYNGALVHYLGFIDTFVAPGEAVHPSDCIAAVLAGAELADASGTELLSALLAGYHAQCRIAGSGVPIMRAGFDHTIPVAIGQAAGLVRVMSLSQGQAAHAIALATVESLALAQTRAGDPVPQWKGLASAAAAFSTVHNVLLAQQGMTGPLDVFEGPLGLERLLGKPLKINWRRERYDGVLSTSIKRYNAEFHSQSCIDGLLDLRRRENFDPRAIKNVRIEIFKAAHEIIGSGKHGESHTVATREDADHSLPFLAAVALLDGELGPRQFDRERIQSPDVQQLLQRVHVRPNLWYSRAYPKKMHCKMVVELNDGRTFKQSVSDYPGLASRPMNVAQVVAKFEALSAPAGVPADVLHAIESCILDLENRSARDLTSLLSRATPTGARRPRAA